MKIKGKVQYDTIESGVWTIVSDNGEKYLPVNMPEQLKIDGEKVELIATRSDQDSIFMTGTPIEIKSFHTLPRFS